MRSPALRFRPLLVVAAAGLVVALVWLRGPDWGGVWHALTRMNPAWAGVAVALNLASALVRGLAWRVVLCEAVPSPHPSVLDTLSAFFVGIFANGVLPARVGELARVGVLARRLSPRRGLWPALLGSVAAHRLLEIVPSLALIVWVLAAAKLPAWAHAALLAVLVGALMLLAIGIVLARRHGQEQESAVVRTALTRVREGLGVLRRPRAASLAASLQAAAWALQLAAVWAAMQAFQLSLSITVAAMVLALINVALLVPLWPGNVGLQQVAVALPLVAYGVAYARGFAYGIGLQAIESSVGYVLGFVFLAREGLSLRVLRTLPAETS